MGFNVASYFSLLSFSTSRLGPKTCQRTGKLKEKLQRAESQPQKPDLHKNNRQRNQTLNQRSCTDLFPRSVVNSGYEEELD